MPSKRTLKIEKNQELAEKSVSPWLHTYLASSLNLHELKCLSLSIQSPNCQLKSSNSVKLNVHRSGKSPSTKPKKIFVLGSYSVAYDVRWNQAQKNLQTTIGSHSADWSQTFSNCWRIALVSSFMAMLVMNIKNRIAVLRFKGKNFLISIKNWTLSLESYFWL